MAMTPVLPAPHQSARLNSLSTTDMKLLDAAKKLEATFLAEMLKSAGFGASRESFGGGVGEDQFSSFLVREQADEIGRSRGYRPCPSSF